MTDRLWTDRAAGDEHEWLASPPRREVRRPALPPPPPPRRRRLRRVLAAAGVLALLGGAGVGGSLIAGGDDPEQERAAAALPAVLGAGAGQTKINEIYAAASKGVVSVQVGQRGAGGASGTGFVIDGDGTIVTNAHVVDGATTAQVRFEDGADPVSAEIVGSDPSSDLAVLRVNPSDVGSPLRPLAFADSDKVRVGDTAVAIGYPLGLDRTATAGIVSGLGREIEAPNGFRIDEVIQTDAPINPGNSGGPLIDSRGRVIGVNSQIATAGAGGGSVGIGFAVPSNTVREVVPQLQVGRTIERAYLGVGTSESTAGSGAVVSRITPGSPAERAGLLAATAPDGSDGDTILEVDGKPVNDPDDVVDAIAARKPGDKVELKVRRGGSTHSVSVELGRRPDSSTP